MRLSLQYKDYWSIFFFHGATQKAMQLLLQAKEECQSQVSISEALGKLNIGGPLPTYVEDQKEKQKCHHHLK